MDAQTWAYIDTKAGGNLPGYLSNLDAAIALVGGEYAQVKIIPGHGPVAAMKELLHYRDFLRAADAHAAKHIGQDPRAVAASFDRNAWSDFKPTPEFVTWESFFQAALAGR